MSLENLPYDPSLPCSTWATKVDLAADIKKLQAKNAELTKAATCWEEQAKMLQHQNDEAFAELRSEIDELTAEVESYRKAWKIDDLTKELRQQLAIAKSRCLAVEALDKVGELNKVEKLSPVITQIIREALATIKESENS